MKKNWWRYEVYKEETQNVLGNKIRYDFLIMSDPYLKQIFLSALGMITSLFLRPEKIKRFNDWFEEYQSFLLDETSLPANFTRSIFLEEYYDDVDFNIEDVIYFIAEAVVNAYVRGISVLAESVEKVIPEEKLKKLLVEIPPFSER
jgi:hypothetical protein